MVGLLILLAFTISAGCSAIDYTLMAKDSYDSHNYDDAIAAARSAVETDSTYAPGWYWLASALWQKGEYDEALEAYHKVIEFQSEAGVNQIFDAYVTMNMIYFSKNDLDKTIEYGTKAIQYYEQNSSNIGENKSYLAVTYTRIGWAHYYNHNFDEAIGLFNKSFVWEAAASVKEWSNRGLGWCHLGKNDYYSARGYFNQALEMAGSDNKSAVQDGLRGRGWANFYLGEYAPALKDFNKALDSIEPDNKVMLNDAFIGKAFCYLGVKDKETALAMIKKAKEVLPSYNPDEHLALIYYAAGEKEKAWEYKGGGGHLGVMLKDYKSEKVTGVEITEVVKDSSAQKAGLLTGDIILRLNNAEVTLSDFLAKIKVLMPGTTVRLTILREGSEKNLTVETGSIEPFMKSNPLISRIITSEAQTYFNRGCDKYNAKNYDGAIVDFTKAIELDPKDAEAVKYRGLAKIAKDDYDNAIVDFTKVVDLKPKSSDDWFGLAMAYSHKRDKERCLDALKKAVGFESGKGEVKSKAQSDKSFDWLRDDADFKHLMGE
jgi:tetratricopeptide (TPR) repeat protein